MNYVYFIENLYIYDFDDLDNMDDLDNIEMTKE